MGALCKWFRCNLHASIKRRRHTHAGTTNEERHDSEIGPDTKHLTNGPLFRFHWFLFLAVSLLRLLLLHNRYL